MFERLEKILDNESLKRLSKIHVLIVGVGGVGGYALEALIRSNIQTITIIDNDKIDETNLNRQIITNQKNIGKNKTKIAKDRALSINPNANINTINEFLLEENINEILIDKYDYIIDACDTINTKIALIKFANENKIKIISSMGTGNKLDPTKLEITEIKKTNYDPVAKIIRKLLKDLNINTKVTVVSSSEKPIKVKDRTPGSLVTVPAVAGMYCASYIINNCINKKTK